MLKKLIKPIIQSLKYKNIKHLTYDDPRIVPLMHCNVKRHGFVRNAYKNFYDIFLSTRNFPEGILIELGTGYGFLKEYSKRKIIRSDVNSDFNIDIKLSAQKLPFKDDSVSAFFMLGVLHHIKDAEMLFEDVLRTLKPQGRLVMIEPFNSPLARLFYRMLHSEPFKPDANWRIEGDNPLSDANLALPWIIFFRDRDKFKSEFPQLKINRMQLHNPLTFQLSGAGAFNTLIPEFLYRPIRCFEELLQPFYKFLAMWVTIELEKL